jgi:heme-degrading monooxygenase HmoA
MIVVANRIPVAKGYEKQFEERFRNRQRLVEQMPGFIKFQLLKPIQGEYYISMTYWESYEAFENWTKSPEFEKAHSANPPPPKEMFAGKNILEIHEVILSSDLKAP